jgi:hypothetical protein
VSVIRMLAHPFYPFSVGISSGEGWNGFVHV